jgi:hypothetical protein
MQVPGHVARQSGLDVVDAQSPGKGNGRFSDLPSAGQVRDDFAAKVKSLTNHVLYEICREEALQTSGIKDQLQSRLIERASFT